MSHDRLLTTIKLYDGWAYRPTGTRAYSIGPADRWPASSLWSLGDPKQTDCVTMTASVLLMAYPSARWSAASVRRLVVGDAAAPWSTIDEVVNAGVGHAVTAAEMVDGHWYLMQGWRLLDNGRIVKASRGHSWFWMPDGPSSGWIAHASSASMKVERVPRMLASQLAKYHEVRILALREG